MTFNVISAQLLQEGQIVVGFSSALRVENSLLSPTSYSITGPTSVRINSVYTVSASQVLLKTVGVAAGSYTLKVLSATDTGGNQVSRFNNELGFTGALARSSRSVFTDRGPIAKPALTLQSAGGALITGPSQVTLPTANIAAAHVGLYVALRGSPSNDGVYRITARVSPTVVKVAASFSQPDPANGTIGWSLMDYRDGQIADDPSDVVVRINDVLVVAEEVVGLLGQVVLPVAPGPTDRVKIDYAWISNPVVDVRRLNSKEFYLNGWNQRPSDSSAHKYRYNSALIKPDRFLTLLSEELTGVATFTSDVTLSDLSGSFLKISGEAYVTMTSGPNKGLRRRVHAVQSNTNLTIASPMNSAIGGSYRIDAADISASRAQPQQRDLKYRAYERAYSVALNDPNLLLLNSPNHRIAFPPMSRSLKSTFVNYQGSALPEASADPWARSGAGSASVSGADLVIEDVSAGAPIFWTRTLDLTFDHAFAHAWRMRLDAAPVPQGVFTGVAAGYSDGEKACVVGYLNVNGTKRLGILRRGFGNDPSREDAWMGGVDSTTGAATAVELDWSTLRSYRIFRDPSGEVRVYIDGAVIALLSAAADDLPFLQELNAPFDQLQGPFFGSLSKEAESTSTWSFVRYTAIPVNPFEVEPSIYVSYEGGTLPAAASQPWTPVGFHGSERVLASHLVLDSTSATDLSSSTASGLISGDFKGYTRIEPLLKESFDTVLDVQLALRTYTHGISANAVMAALDDGNRLIQLSFFSDQASPKLSYGGRAAPPDFQPYGWVPTGTQPAAMVGQYLQISDSSASDGLSYTVEDTYAVDDPARVLSYSDDYMFEFRVRVVSYSADVHGFCGVTASAYDGQQSVGVQFIEYPEYREEQPGQVTETLRRYVELHSEGVGLAAGRFAFEWNDGEFHTIRATKSTLGGQVSLFADGDYLGGVPYLDFMAPLVPSLVGKASFGSMTPLSTQAQSVVIWAYSNYWRVTNGRKFVGLWKGYDSDSLAGYHLPVSVSGRSASVNGNVLSDSQANFSASGTQPNDQLIVNDGPNEGVYTVAAVAPQGDPTKLTVLGQFRASGLVDYRCVVEVDWTIENRYRIVKDPGGGVSVFLNSVTKPLIHADYSSTALPPSTAGIPQAICAGLPSVTWGAFDPTNLSQTSWDFVRFGAIRSLSATGIASHHEILNQANVMASYEHHRSSTPHQHACFGSESEGIPPQTAPDLLRDPNLGAFTLLNEGTPLVPATQSYRIRAPETLVVPVAGLNSPQDVLNHTGFLVNNAAQRVEVLVPDDVLYNSLQVIERTTGDSGLIAPFDDEAEISLGSLEFRNEVCLSYDGSVLPENDTVSPQWVRASEDASHQSMRASISALTYRTDASGTRTICRNATPLLTTTSLRTEVKFRLRLVQDASEGLGDSQVRFGFSSPGVTVGLAFVTTPAGERYVMAVDLNDGQAVGGIPFDFYDGNYHTYVLSRDPASESIQIRVEP